MTETETLSGKPLFDKILPLDEGLLREHNFYELYPLDGGGSLVQGELLGTIKDAEITEKILTSDTMRAWGQLPDLDYIRLERWRTIEKSCWLNRFYFLVSLARQYWLTGDVNVAEIVKKTILNFVRNCKPPKGEKSIREHFEFVEDIRVNGYNKQTYEENFRDETDVQYLWFDFQPASRFLHFSYCLRFLENWDGISQSEWAEIIDSLHDHAELILIQEQKCAELGPGNHQSFRGMILLLASVLFKGKGRWEEFLSEGIRVCDYHIRNDFLKDGALAEMSPSYHCFETWHVRNAVSIAKQHNLNLCEQASGCLERATQFIRAISQPDGFNPVINDGYAVNLKPFLATLPDDSQQENPSRFKAFFEDSGWGVYKDEHTYMLLDASIFTGECSHYHAGKNAITYWHASKPFLVDSGCCGYEDELFTQWYRQPKAHSSLLVDGEGDGLLTGIYSWGGYATPKCKGWIKTDSCDSIRSELTSSVKTWQGCSWSRQVDICNSGKVAVIDDVSTKDQKEFCFIFNCHPDVKVTKNESGFLLKNDDTSVMLQLKLSNGELPDACLEKGKYYGPTGHEENQQVHIRITANEAFQMTSEFIPLG